MRSAEGHRLTLAATIQAWLERQRDPKPFRREAIQRLIEKGLETAGGR